MKHLFTLLILMILSSNIYAQKILPACQSVEWLRTVSDTAKYSIERTVIDSNQDFVVWGTYDYSPTPFQIAGLNVPPVPLMMYVRDQYFIMKTDSNGIGKWFFPFEIIKKKVNYYDVPEFNIYDLKLDKQGNIYIVIGAFFSLGGEFRFLGTTYSRNGENGIMIFKLNPLGQLISSTFIEVVNPWGSSSYYNPQFIETSDSNFIMMLKDGWKYKVNNQMLDDSSLYYSTILKLSGDLNTILWSKMIKAIGRYDLSIKESVNHDLYIFGQCEGYGCEFKLDKFIIKADFPKTTSDTRMNYFFKLDLKTGSPLWAKTFGNTTASGGTSIDLNVDAKDNVYISGRVRSTTTTNYMLTLDNATTLDLQKSDRRFLLRYEPDSQKYAIMLFDPTTNINSIVYVPYTKRMLIGGYYSGNNDFIVDSTRSSDAGTFVLSINTETPFDSLPNYVEGVKSFKPEWLAYTQSNWLETRPGGSYPQSLYSDKRGKIYLSGNYGYGNIFDRFYYNTINQNFTGRPGERKGSWHAKLGFLSNEIVKDTVTLVAVQDSAFYQWVDCGNNNQPVPGATNQRFLPKAPGNYGVLVSNAFCAVQSPCLFTMQVTERDLLEGVQIYPNPVSNTLNLNNLPIGVAIAVYDVLGRKVYAASVQQSSLKINTESWSQGVYWVQLNYQGERRMSKVAK